jgi:hypothetical protein
MVFITGDIHGDPRDLIRFSKAHLLTSEDTIIILGDAGFNFYLHGRDRNAKKLAARIPATLLCIHGNHEARPQSLPELYHEEERFGATVMVEDVFPNILFAVDGEVYDIEGFFTIAIGGAYSIDKLWRRENGLPWFANEQPNEQTKQRVEQVLAARDWKVDVVLSRTCPAKHTPTEAYFSGIDQSKVDKSTEDWLDTIEDRLTYQRWYCGHWHINKHIDCIHFLFSDVEEFAVGLSHVN